MNELALAEIALTRSWQAMRPEVPWMPEHPPYVCDFKDNLTGWK